MKNKKNILIMVVILVLVAAVLILFITIRTEDKNKFVINGSIDNTIEVKTNMKIKSLTFKEGEMIPEKYTCDADNINPPLSISNVPDNAKSLVLIVDDPDAPMGTWNHLLAWNIDPSVAEISEGQMSDGAVLGKNDFGEDKYGGPCPPSGMHRYYFRLYALDTMLDLDSSIGRSVLEKAMEGHVVSQTSLMGKYSRGN